jgi:hypothetical protein
MNHFVQKLMISPAVGTLGAKPLLQHPRPGEGIDLAPGNDPPTVRMAVGAVLSSLWPAAAVVAGNVIAGHMGYEEPAIAVRRAVVGLLCAVGSACVSSPALALLIMGLKRQSGEPIDASRACAGATRLVAPMWACGVVAALPPIFGLGPEVGELLWVGLAVVIAALAARNGLARALEVRRRWHVAFVLTVSLAAGLLIVGTMFLPAVGLRWTLGAATPLPLPRLDPVFLPFPPPPNW